MYGDVSRHTYALTQALRPPTLGCGEGGQEALHLGPGHTGFTGSGFMVFMTATQGLGCVEGVQKGAHTAGHRSLLPSALSASGVGLTVGSAARCCCSCAGVFVLWGFGSRNAFLCGGSRSPSTSRMSQQPGRTHTYMRLQRACRTAKKAHQGMAAAGVF